MRLRKKPSPIDVRGSHPAPEPATSPVVVVDNLASMRIPVACLGQTVPLAQLTGFGRLADRVAFDRENQARIATMRQVHGSLLHVQHAKPPMLQWPSQDDLWLSSQPLDSPASSASGAPNPFEAMPSPIDEAPDDVPPPTPPKDYAYLRPLAMWEKERHARAERTLQRAYQSAAARNANRTPSR